MKKKLTRFNEWLLFLFFTLASLNVFSAVPLAFQRVSPPGGFTLVPVLKISQDKRGFIWFITREKLYQFNTQDFISFDPIFQSGVSHTNNSITSLLIDQNDRIWIGTNAGIAQFKQQSGQLETKKLTDPEMPERILGITDMKQDKNGKIWITEGSALGQLDTVKMEMNYVRLNGARINVGAFCFADKDQIYAANSDGEIFSIDIGSMQAAKLSFRFPPLKLHGIFLIDNVIWITSDGEGLRRYSLNGRLLDEYFTTRTDIEGNYSPRVRDVFQSSDGNIWVTSAKGLLRWDNGRFDIYRSSYNDQFSLPDNSTQCIFEDSQKGLWIGTWRGGLGYLNPYSNTFEIYQNNPDQNSVSGNLISSIAQDEHGVLWIGADGSGIDTFDESEKQFRHISLAASDQNGTNNIKCIYPDQNGDIWVGTYREGVFRKKRGESLFKHAFLSGANVYDLVSDGEKLWIATYNRGLFYYQYSSGEIKNFDDDEDGNSLPSNYLRKLLLDSRQNLWVISNAGVFIKAKDKTTFEPLPIGQNENRSSIQVYTIASDAEGKIWLGTNIEIVSVDKNRTLNRKSIIFNGKPLSVYGIVAIDSNQFWLSSNYGIFRYNPENGSYLNYSSLDGLPSDLFNANAFCRTNSGKIYFGGTTGMIAFNPAKFQINPFVPKAFFSRIFINHQEVHPGQKDSPLEKPLYETETLRMKPSQNSFSIEFVALNYLNPQKNQFRYRLKGFDNTWVDAGSISRATYTNISPGRYVFEVMTCNNDGVWGQEPAKLTIFIPRPILFSHTAKIIYLVLLLALGFLVRRIILYRSRLERQIEIERLQRMQEEKSHQEKLVFFTNISHELRTPLTLITGPTELLMKSPNLTQTQYNQLSLIKRNSGRLLKLINQLLEFRRIENKKMELTLCESDLVEFVHDIFNYFTDIAQQKNISYAFIPHQEQLPVTFDSEKIDKAVFNLLSNAFKFTPEKGSVKLEITTGQRTERSVPAGVFRIGELIDPQYVQISVEDNGPGIDASQFEKIFDRFYQIEGSENRQSGTGIGLHLTKHLILLHGGEIELESQPGKGSIFRLRIPSGEQSVLKLKSRTDLKVNLAAIPCHTENQAFSADDHGELYTENWSTQAQNHRKDERLILVVEDHQDLRHFICHSLSEDYRIISAENGLDGIEKARIFLPDLIVSDILMPGKSGIELVKELKSDLNTSHIPIVLLTALTTDEYKIESFSTGADDYIEKPFSTEILKARIKSIFSNREALQQFYVSKIAQGFESDLPETPDKKMLLKAVAFVEKNITDEQMGIDTLAGYLNLSRSTLHRKLKSLTNKSATDFIRTIRLEYAARLLKDGRDNIDEISAMSGFNSHSYFTRSFKEHFGKTPSEFVNIHQLNKRLN